MNEYMVTIKLPLFPNAEFLSLIPGQRAQINELMQKGILLSYSLSEDRGTLWAVILASSEQTVEETIQTMPVYRFMQYEISELMFHNIPTFASPKFSLN